MKICGITENIIGYIIEGNQITQSQIQSPPIETDHHINNTNSTENNLRDRISIDRKKAHLHYTRSDKPHQ